MGAVVYLGAGWPPWKPLGIPGTHLPLKRGSWLNLVKCNLTKLTTTSLAVKRSTSLAVTWFISLAVKRFTNLGLAGHRGSPWVSQAPTFHLSEAVG